MRGYIDKDFSSFFNEELENYLLEGSDEFVDATFLKKEAQLAEEMKCQSSDTQKYASYEKMANELRAKFGYGDSPTAQKDSQGADKSEQKVETVDFTIEIAAYLEKQKILTGQAASFVEKVHKNYEEKPVLKETLFLTKHIFAKEVTSIRALPGFSDLSDEGFKMVLLAIVTQNSS